MSMDLATEVEIVEMPGSDYQFASDGRPVEGTVPVVIPVGRGTYRLPIPWPIRIGISHETPDLWVAQLRDAEGKLICTAEGPGYDETLGILLRTYATKAGLSLGLYPWYEGKEPGCLERTAASLEQIRREVKAERAAEAEREAG